jgi:uncharacterized membrane protein YebE (DUF533 family)
MFNPEKLLEGLIRTRTPGAGRLFKGSAAMALLGVALGAAEHYLANPSQPPTPQRPTGKPPPTPPPQAPPPYAVQTSTAVPPPPPGVGPATIPSDPMGTDQKNRPAVLLIRAMIAAANADGHIDTQERERILKKLQPIELSVEEQAFLSKELLTPAPLEDIVHHVEDRKMAVQVYAVSRLAIDVDTEVEHQYLQRLAHQLDLDTQTVQAIEAKLRSAPPVGQSSTKGV